MNIQTLRAVGFLEGLSFLLLLFIAMPMKYMWGNPILVKYVGMGHGVLFVCFFSCFICWIVKNKNGHLTCLF
ncbi:DUF3817 domain-containing protein [Serratia proteamaculans]